MSTIIIVEGKSDTNRLREIYPNIQTFETSGLGIDEKKIRQIKMLSKEHKMIVFTDPDGPGEIIRKIINEQVGGLYQAYLPNDKALSKNKKKIGIEHGLTEDIKIALDNLYELSDVDEVYEISDLMDIGIYYDKAKRVAFCDDLHIAYGNNKKVLKQLNSFNISIEKINETLRRIHGTSEYPNN